MNTLVCLVILAGVVAVTEAEDAYAKQVPILKDDRTQNSYGEYSLRYQTGDSVTREESGSQKDGQVSQGGWRYKSPGGHPVEITFVADHGGYRPQGAVIPVAPPLPYQRSGH
ncbi:endocuticle structural glycoprotein SgAbd-2-like [Panulirus ornatus]|uniref:endocuticle structural glycoprotein SgAbd-2-like n=1 Tax=Panulirus ornatus TaxID=150431 RepID=UPI003A887E4C